MTEQYRYRLFVEVTLQRTGGDVLLEMGQLTGFGTYDAALPDEDDQGREPAIDAAMDMVIEEIVDRITASW